VPDYAFASDEGPFLADVNSLSQLETSKKLTNFKHHQTFKSRISSFLDLSPKGF